MSDTARDYQTIDTATVEGLEDLFADTEKTSGPDLGPSRDEDSGPSQLISALEAASILGINKRSVIRLIQQQKLVAIKRDGKYLLTKEAVENRKRESCLTVPSRVMVARPSQGEVALDIEVSGPSRDEDPAVFVQVDEAPSNSIDAYKLLKELEGATYRIGYLEAQLAERDQQIKLLTDSKHKSSLWARFKKWCAGN